MKLKSKVGMALGQRSGYFLAETKISLFILLFQSEKN